MSNIVPLNNIYHANLKIKTTAEYVANVDSVLTFPTEFIQVQREYPIFFQKNPKTDKFQSVVFLGIAASENLYVNNGEWQANYIPAIITCDPFIIGFEDQTVLGGSEREPVVYINTESPLVSETEGEAVFREFGGNTPYLDKITRNLNLIYQGLSLGEEMFSLFSELDLIEPVKLEIKLINGELYRFSGNYTINSEKLASLSGDNLEKLNRAGLLECAFFVVASLNNIQKLIEMKNNRV